MDICDYCHDELTHPAALVADPSTGEVCLACDRCGHVITLETVAHRRALRPAA